jgi:predicted AAA+ superfamily ATPase
MDQTVKLEDLLAYGSMPSTLTTKSNSERARNLRDYAGSYLKEEIQAEALLRDIQGFSRFLKVAAASSSGLLDMTKLSSQAQVKRTVAIRYFEILEDTLIVDRVEAFSRDERRRLIQHPRYFFFDNGVLNGVLGNFSASLDRVGYLFENFIYSQITAAKKAYDIHHRVSTYRTEHGAEVDLILEGKRKTIALEIKASKNVGKNDLRGFESFKTYYGKKFYPVVAYMGQRPKVVNGIPILPWKEALTEVFRLLS